MCLLEILPVIILPRTVVTCTLHRPGLLAEPPGWAGLAAVAGREGGQESSVSSGGGKRGEETES